jgi:hypothetical protein
MNLNPMFQSGDLVRICVQWQSFNEGSSSLLLDRPPGLLGLVKNSRICKVSFVEQYKYYVIVDDEVHAFWEYELRLIS